MDAAGAALLPKFGAYVVQDALGEAMAVTSDRDEAQVYLARGRDYLHEAASCGHPLAPGWAAEREPLTVRLVTVEERDDILLEGTPVLQREP